MANQSTSSSTLTNVSEQTGFKGPTNPFAPKNRLLAKLPLEDFRRIRPSLQTVDLEFKKTIYEPGVPIDHAYFVEAGLISVVSVMDNGSIIEIATIGNEGVAGWTLSLGVDRVPNRYLVQIEGRAFRISGDVLRRETTGETALKRILQLYNATFMTQVMQGVACNGLHSVQQRCCRWLLMCQDRAESDEYTITHEFLSQMLGVRRASVTDVLRPLQERGLISYGRGKMRIVDRKALEETSCECYRAICEEFDRLLA